MDSMKKRQKNRKRGENKNEKKKRKINKRIKQRPSTTVVYNDGIQRREGRIQLERQPGEAFYGMK